MCYCEHHTPYTSGRDSETLSFPNSYEYVCNYLRFETKYVPVKVNVPSYHNISVWAYFEIQKCLTGLLKCRESKMSGWGE